MQVHQLIPCFTAGDAMGQVAVAWQRALRHLGFPGEIYAGEVAPGLELTALDARALAPASDDLVLYHHGIASDLAGRLMHLRCRRGLVYHNITPARFYPGLALREALVAGRAQLAALAGSVDVAIGVSAFNARELRAAGFAEPQVVPLFVEPERFREEEADAALLARLRRRPHPRLLSVGRVVPHKRLEDLLALHAELREIEPSCGLTIVGGYAPGQAAFRALEARADAVGGVEFLQRVSHAGLVAAYRAADVYVSMSEHEGFGVPLIEAMAAEVPVLAFGAAAVLETMGGRGLVFDEKRFVSLAEVARLLARDAPLRRAVLAGQRERVAELSMPHTIEALRSALAPLVRSRPRVRDRVLVPPRTSRRRVPRVAVVVQRYGADITGGAEAHARAVALRLAERARVEVLTTCAVDHLTWADDLPEGVEQDGAVRVERFRGVMAREMRAFNRLSDRTFGQAHDLLGESQWVNAQGPLVPGLWTTLARRREEWDAVVFFTYLYAPTVRGLPLVAGKALLVPTAHDEPPLRFHLFSDVFERPRALLCNTPEEEALIVRRFPKAARTRVVGVGIEAPEVRPERFREKHGLREPYLLYVGRLEEGKGVLALVEAHQRLTRTSRSAPVLVLAGAGHLAPRGDRVRVLGRIEEQDKWDGLAGALAVCVPSRYESLSLLTLEAFAVGTPVVGNAASEVVAGQLARSGAGVSYSDAASFSAALGQVEARREALSAQAKRYARGAQWSRVLDVYLEEIDRVRHRT